MRPFVCKFTQAPNPLIYSISYKSPSEDFQGIYYDLGKNISLKILLLLHLVWSVSFFDMYGSGGEVAVMFIIKYRQLHSFMAHMDVAAACQLLLLRYLI